MTFSNIFSTLKEKVMQQNHSQLKHINNISIYICISHDFNHQNGICRRYHVIASDFDTVLAFLNENTKNVNKKRFTE